MYLNKSTEKDRLLYIPGFSVENSHLRSLVEASEITKAHEDNMSK